MARRHARLLLPQRDRRLPAGDGDAGRAPACRRRPARRAAARRCPAARSASSIRTRRRVADLQKFGKLGPYNGAYGDDIHIFGVTLSKNIAGVSVGAELSYRAEHAAAERSGAGAAGGVRAARARARSRRPPCPTQRHAGRAGRHVARRAQRRQHLPARRRCSTPRRWRASSPGCSGRRSRRTRRCSRAAAATRRSTRSSKNFFGLAINFTPTWFQVLPGRRPARAGHLDARASPATPRSLFGGNEGGGNYSVGVAADIYQKYRVDLKYSGYYGDYSTNPTAATPAGGVHGRAQRRQRVAVRSRLGLAHVQDHVLSEDAHHVSQDIAGRELRGAVRQRRRIRGGLGRRGQAARHDADRRSAPRRPATRTARFPSTPAAYQAAGRASRRAAASAPTRSRARSRASSITGKDAAAHADKLTEGTKELLKRYPTMRVDVYPTHRTVALPQRVLDNTLKNATGAKTVDGGVALENVLAGYPFPIPKTGSEAMWNHLLRYNGLGYDSPRTRTGTSTRPACRRSPSRPMRTGRGRSTTRRRPGRSAPAIRTGCIKLHYVGPARRNGEALLVDRRGQPAEAAAPRLAVPAGPAPREARARPRLRHAEPRRRRRGDLRRRVRCSTARSTATTGSSSARRRCTSRTAATG